MSVTKVVTTIHYDSGNTLAIEQEECHGLALVCPHCSASFEIPFKDLDAAVIAVQTHRAHSSNCGERP